MYSFDITEDGKSIVSIEEVKKVLGDEFKSINDFLKNNPNFKLYNVNFFEFVESTEKSDEVYGYFSEDEVAEILQCSLDTIKELINKKSLRIRQSEDIYTISCKSVAEYQRSQKKK